MSYEQARVMAGEYYGALAFDERVWRAFMSLKTIHREGFLAALRAVNNAEVERLRGLLTEVIAIARAQGSFHDYEADRVDEIEAGL